MLRAGLRVGDSEKDVADALEGYSAPLRRDRVELPADRGGGGSVGTAACPADHDDTRSADDDFVLIDWGATGQPYKSDLTRVLVTGKVTPKFETIYRTVLCRSRTWNRRDPAGRRKPTTSMPKPAPSSRRRVSAVFLTTALVTGWAWTSMRPRGYARSSVDARAGYGGYGRARHLSCPIGAAIRIEDDVLVTPDGCEVLSRLPKSLDSVRLE